MHRIEPLRRDRLRRDDVRSPGIPADGVAIIEQSLSLDLLQLAESLEQAVLLTTDLRTEILNLHSLLLTMRLVVD